MGIAINKENIEQIRIRIVIFEQRRLLDSTVLRGAVAENDNYSIFDQLPDYTQLLSVNQNWQS